MNTKQWKRVPFTIELAKDIQSGKVEGRIIINGDILDISRWALDPNPVDNKLEIIDGKYNKCVGSLKDNNELFIELPEDEPIKSKHEFKVGDIVKIVDSKSYGKIGKIMAPIFQNEEPYEKTGWLVNIEKVHGSFFQKRIFKISQQRRM